VAHSSECGNKPRGCIMLGEFIDWLRTSWLTGRTLFFGVSCYKRALSVIKCDLWALFAVYF
jgi:hypothetical protein